MPKRKQGLKDYFQQIMDKEIAEIRQLPFEEADSLTGKTSTGQAPIAKYRLYFRDAGEKEVIIKRKSSKII